MANSAEYTSLFALVDSHLSKTSINSDKSSIENHNNGHNSTTSEGQIIPSLCSRLPASPFSKGSSSIHNILAEQVSNMLKAKEKKKQEEERKMLLNNTPKVENKKDDTFVIDLMQALQTPYNPPKPIKKEKELSRSQSFEKLFQLKLDESTEESRSKVNPRRVLLSQKSNMKTYTRKMVRAGKPSTFGKVMSSRFRCVTVPYREETLQFDIKAFDFATPSPCDIFKSKLKRPTMSCTYTAIIEF
ncbi:unnamed protein product [Leptosia nina]|uniref:Uncharacterized protein n=1 Tax=Leptosia nina TaxID=320188 RepID=A0AAV1JZA8_9NEOP